MKAKTKTFEEKMQRLEEIVRAMERGDVALEESLKLFKQLEEAKMQVTKITAGADGAPQEEPFADEI